MSTDRGATWALSVPTDAPVYALAYGAGALYTGLGGGAVMAKIGTAPWATVLQGGSVYGRAVVSLAADPFDPKHAIAVVWDPGVTTTLEARDGGGPWPPWPPPPVVGSCASGGISQLVAFDASRKGLLYSASGGRVHVSLDGGASWSQKPLGEDIRMIAPIAKV